MMLLERLFPLHPVSCNADEINVVGKKRRQAFMSCEFQPACQAASSFRIAVSFSDKPSTSARPIAPRIASISSIRIDGLFTDIPKCDASGGRMPVWSRPQISGTALYSTTPRAAVPWTHSAPNDDPAPERIVDGITSGCDGEQSSQLPCRELRDLAGVACDSCSQLTRLRPQETASRQIP